MHNKLLMTGMILAFLFTESLQGQEFGDRDPPLNILLIAVDDLRPELGCYGLAHAQSPHLDRFSESAVIFSNHFVQVPTCGASRYAMLTGRSPMNSGALGNGSFYQGRTRLTQHRLEGARTFPELFRRNGYHTICIGKISHTPDGKVFAYDGSGDGRHELPQAWDELATPYAEWKRGWGTFFAYHGGRHREDGNGHKDLMEFIAESDDELPDGLMAETAIAKLAELKQQRDDQRKPFLMGLGFFKPHLPWVATRGDWDAFDDVEIPAPNCPGKLESLWWHRSGEFYKYNMTLEKTRPLSVADQITAKRAYLACVRYVDRQIGRVLDSLDDLGLSQNTIVIVWGDHGWHLGESAIWGKHSPFDRSLRSVLMIRVPGISRPGHRCEELVESIDLFPTLLDLCQPKFQKTAWTLDGFSLDAMLKGGHEPVRKAALGFINGGFTARSKTHRYIGKAKEYPFRGNGVDSVSEQEFYNLTASVDPVNDSRNSESEELSTLLSDLPRKNDNDE